MCMYDIATNKEHIANDKLTPYTSPGLSLAKPIRPNNIIATQYLSSKLNLSRVPIKFALGKTEEIRYNHNFHHMF